MSNSESDRKLRRTQRRAAALLGTLLAVPWSASSEPARVRVTTAFDRMLELPGASVTGAERSGVGSSAWWAGFVRLAAV